MDNSTPSFEEFYIDLAGSILVFHIALDNYSKKILALFILGTEGLEPESENSHFLKENKNAHKNLQLQKVIKKIDTGAKFIRLFQLFLTKEDFKSSKEKKSIKNSIHKLIELRNKIAHEPVIFSSEFTNEGLQDLIYLDDSMEFGEFNEKATTDLSLYLETFKKKHLPNLRLFFGDKVLDKLDEVLKDEAKYVINHAKKYIEKTFDNFESKIDSLVTDAQNIQNSNT
jgi:hypothetical protein